MSRWSRLRKLYDMAAPGGWVYRNAHYLVADVDIDASAARRWLPPALRIASPARASIFTAWFPENTFGSVYCEAGLLLHALHRGKPCVFSPWMIVDDDVALILGRELLGYPKKLGEIDFDIDGREIRGVARRRGTELIRMEGTIGEVVEPPPPILARPHRNVRGALGLSIPRLIAFTPRERVIDVRRVALSLEVRGSERDPLPELGFGAVRDAFLHRVDLAGSLPPVPLSWVSPLWYVEQWLLRSR